MDESKTADIVELIGGLDDGALYAQLQDDLTDLVAALRKRFAAAGGSPKAKLRLDLVFRFDGKIVEILPSVTTQLPRPVRGKGVFWATRDNKLSPQNPQQLELGVPPRCEVVAEREPLPGDLRLIAAKPAGPSCERLPAQGG